MSTENYFYIGQRVSAHGKMTAIDFKGQIGVIIGLSPDAALVKFSTRFSDLLHDGNAHLDPTSCSYYIFFHLLTPIDKGKRILNLEDDPWGEENWGVIKENVENSDELTNLVIKINNEFEFRTALEFFYLQDYRWPGGVIELDDRYDNDKYIIVEPKKVIISPTSEDDYRMKDKKIISFKNFMKIVEKMSKKRRVYKPDIDPWNEENWGWEEIKESNKIDNLKNFYIPFNTKEEMIAIAKKLHEMGYVVCNYGDAVRGYGFENVFHKIYAFSKIHDFFARTNMQDSTINYKTKLDFEDFMKIDIYKRKRITNPDIDPWSEEDWGWEEIVEQNEYTQPRVCISCDNKNEIKTLLKILEERGYLTLDNRLPTEIKFDHIKDFIKGIILLDERFQGKTKSIIFWNVANGMEFYTPRRDDIVIPFNGFVNNKKYKRIYRDDDPWNEENWGWEEIDESSSDVIKKIYKQLIEIIDNKRKIGISSIELKKHFSKNKNFKNLLKSLRGIEWMYEREKSSEDENFDVLIKKLLFDKILPDRIYYEKDNLNEEVDNNDIDDPWGEERKEKKELLPWNTYKILITTPTTIELSFGWYDEEGEYVEEFREVEVFEQGDEIFIDVLYVDNNVIECTFDLGYEYVGVGYIDINNFEIL